MRGRRSEIRRCYRLAELLLSGIPLDRERVASELGIKAGAANRHIRAITEEMPSVQISTGKGGRTILSVPRERLHPRPTRPTAVAACIGASLSRLFRGTAYEEHLQHAANQVLDRLKLRTGFEDHDRKFVFLTRGGEQALQHGSGNLDAFIDGILEHRVVKVVYEQFDGERKTLRVEPLTILLHEHQLYVVVNGEKRRELLRLARVRTAETLSRRFEYPARHAYDPHQLFRDSIGIFLDSEKYPVQEVVLLLDAKWKSYAKTHRWHESQTQSEVGEKMLVRLRVRACPDAERLVLGFGEECEVIEPAGLRRRIGDRTSQAAKRYRQAAPRIALTAPPKRSPRLGGGRARRRRAS